MSEDQSEIKQSLDLIQKAIIVLDKKVEAQNIRIEKLETGKSDVGNVQQPISAAATSAQPQQIISDEKNEKFDRYFKPVENSVDKETQTEKEDSLEENIGGKWFARIGITALVLGISFFLKYAFDNDWIGETGRIVIGVALGLVLLGIGEKTIRKYFLYGQIITGGGIAVLYLSIFSAFNFYHLIGSFATFFLMIIITTIGIVLSVRYDALSLAAIAIIGGFATPIMASNGENNQVALLSYLVLLDLAILIVSVFKRWHVLNIVGFSGTFLLFLTWGEKFYTREDLFMTMFFMSIFFFIYSISALVYNLVKKEKSTGIEQILTLATATVYFAVSYILLDRDFHAFMGFFAMILAIYYFLWAFLVRSITPEDENMYGFLAFLTVGFVTLSIPIQLEDNIITIGWAIEAALLMAIGAKLKKRPIIVFSMFVSGLVLLRYFLFDNMKYGDFTFAVFNSIFFTAIIVICAFYAIAMLVHLLLDEDNKVINKKSLIAIFIIVANFITVFSVSREISQSYERDIQVLYRQQNQYMQNSRQARLDGFEKYQQPYEMEKEKIKNLKNKSSISLSIFWLIYSVLLLAIGILFKHKGIRLGGLALLMLAIFKLFFIDLWNLGTLYRIISSISLGIVLLAISFVYQKHKEKIKEII